MATSTITIYKTGISKNKNAKIDGIENFLATKTSIETLNAQRIRHALSILIKLDNSQKIADTNEYDYCKIVNSDTNKAYYYFINSMTATAQKTITFNLSLDTLNTFFDDLAFSDKTYIEREHKDRYRQSTKRIVGSTVHVCRQIDLVSEGNAPLKYLETETRIKPRYKFRSPTTTQMAYSNLECEWYLSYKADSTVTESSNLAITTNLYPQGEATMFYRNTEQIERPTSTTNQHSYCIKYFASNSNFNKKTDSITAYNSDGSSSKTISFDGTAQYIIWQQGNNRILKTTIGRFVNTKTVKIDFTIAYIIINAEYYYYASSPNATYDTTMTQTANEPTAQSVNQLDQLNRTDTKLMKVIALPYPPFDLVQHTPSLSNELDLDLPSDWTITNNTITSLVANITLESLIASFNLPITDSFSATDIVSTALRNDNNESKIYHSDYYSPTLVYDSFSLPVDLERATPLNYLDNSIDIYFKATNTINSKFAFMIDFESNGITYDNIKLFENYLICERNNELPIYTSNFIQYLRTGYNYDIKTQKLGFASMGISFFQNLIDTASGKGTATSKAADIASSVGDFLINGIQTQNAFEQKQAQMKEQAASVSGSTDFDIMSWYNGNKAYWNIYQCSDRQKKNFLNLFYYCGYAVREMAKPNINSRYWFNYLQCTPHFETTKSYITNSYLSDITTRLQEGVTIYHNHSNTWDFAQLKENWETWLLS